MNIVTKTIADSAIGVSIANDPVGLKCFLEPECAATIWRRQTPETVQTWLNNLDPKVLPKGRIVLQPHAIAAAVGHLCDIAELPKGPERDWLEVDIAALADVFSNLVSAQFLRLRLDIVTTNACRKFHVDAIKSRLVCTYRGTGTQFGNSLNGQDPETIFTVQTGAPILLRGSLWPAEPSAGLLHRSPPIENTGETRLVLVLDPIIDPEEEK